MKAVEKTKNHIKNVFMCGKTEDSSSALKDSQQ